MSVRWATPARSKPPAPGGAGALEMTTADFTTWIDYLATRVAAGGVICQPIGELYDEFYGLTV